MGGLAFPGNPYAGKPAQSSWVDHWKEAGKRVRGAWLPRSQRVRFASFHFRSEVRGECEAELCWARHAHLAEEGQEFLRRFLVAVDCLLRIGQSNVCFSLSRFAAHVSEKPYLNISIEELNSREGQESTMKIPKNCIIVE